MNLKGKNALLYKALFISLTFNCFAYSASFAMDDEDSYGNSAASKVTASAQKTPETAEGLEARLAQQANGSKSLTDALNLLKLRPTEAQYEALFGENLKATYAAPITEKTEGETEQTVESSLSFNFAYWRVLKDLVPTQTPLAIKLFDALSENFGVLVTPIRVEEFNTKAFTEHVISKSNQYAVDSLGSLPLDVYRLISRFNSTMKLNDELKSMGASSASSARLRGLMFNEDGMLSQKTQPADTQNLVSALGDFIKDHHQTRFKVVEDILDVSGDKFNVLLPVELLVSLGSDAVRQYILQRPALLNTYRDQMGALPEYLDEKSSDKADGKNKANTETSDKTADAATTDTTVEDNPA